MCFKYLSGVTLFNCDASTFLHLIVKDSYYLSVDGFWSSIVNKFGVNRWKECECWKNIGWLSTCFSSGSKQEFNQFKMNDVLSLRLLKDSVEDISILVAQLSVNLPGSVVDSKIERRAWYVFAISNSYYVNTFFDCIQSRWSYFNRINGSAAVWRSGKWIILFVDFRFYPNWNTKCHHYFETDNFVLEIKFPLERILLFLHYSSAIGNYHGYSC